MKAIETREEFENIKASDKVSLVDFWAQWCGPCRATGPVLEELEGEYDNVDFYKLNVDDFQDIASRMTVFAIPTVIFFKNGVEVARQQGAAGKESYKRTINGVLNG